MTPEILLSGKVQLWCGDCREVLSQIPDNSIDSCVTDPPYSLVSILKRFGKDGSAPAKSNGATGVYRRASAGFMSARWDTGEVAFDPNFWKEVLRVLKPGAHLLAMGGTRTFHHLAMAIEDAGFEIRDQIEFDHATENEYAAFESSLNDEQCRQFTKLFRERGIGRLSWKYGSGFPKSHDVSKGIDRAAGAVREAVGITRGGVKPNGGYGADGTEGLVEADKWRPVTKPATDAAIIWQGWGTALKPACEPIVLARKPLIGTVVANVLKHGVGALNIDGCRVATDGEQPKGSGDRRGGDIYAQDEWTRTKMTNGGNVTPSLGRWPANVIHDGSEEVVGAFPDAPGQQRAVGPYGPRDQFEPRDDSGTAARFFYQVEKDTLCDLCSLPFGHASAKVFPCNVSNAELNLPTGNTPTGASVLSNVAESPAPESVGKSHRSNGRASSVGNHSLQCHPQKASTAREGVLTLDELKIVQNVKSAASLCNLCATTIAHALAEVRQSGNAAPVHFNPSIGLFKETILSHCLASYVENRESTDTILTTTNLRELFGCVFHAIAESTNSERVGSAANIKSASKRLFYSSKADSDDRLGSKHPTVKPLDLMQYMVRLVTPPKGLVLDLFAGTGTTGEAAWREGFSAVLIEREAEYQADIRRRMALCLSGPDERARASIKAKMAGKPDDHGPLFGGVA